ncbi:MAG: ferredoxin reductase family protein [Sporichthyaceae bacterium]
MAVEALGGRSIGVGRRVRRARAEVVVETVPWLSLAAATALWATGPGAADLTSSAANAVVALGRLCGLWSANLLLIQVLLMARIPAVERVLGRDVAVRRHRVVGYASFVLLWVHVLAVTSGYASLVNANLLRQSWDLVANYPGMLLAAAAAVALTLVAATSARRARRRLRYESWHLLHLYAYLGVALALPHQLWVGADFAAPLARLYWVGLYGCVVIALLACRVGLPLWRTLRHQITVAEVVREADDVVSVYLRGRALRRLPVRAGQFFQWRFLDGSGWSRAHPYSLSAAPTPNALRLTAKGDVSRLAGLRPGTWVAIEGPYGRLTAARRAGSRVVLLGCGIGVTPLRALAEELPYAYGDAVLIHRVRRQADLVFAAEFDELVARRGLVVHRLVGPRRPDRPSWLPTGGDDVDDVDGLRRLVPDLDDVDVFVCGPEEWTAAVREAALAAGVPRSRVHVERFAW